MNDPLQAIESRLQATVTPAERRRAQRDAWQVLQLLHVHGQIRDLRLESERAAAVAADGSEVA
jgi:hypothetical protein